MYGNEEVDNKFQLKIEMRAIDRPNYGRWTLSLNGQEIY